jgi:hypothetical protein
VLGSSFVSGSTVTAQYVQTSGYPAVALLLTATVAADQQSVAATLTWHRVDQVAPLDWTIQAAAVLGSATSALAAPTGLRSQVAGSAVTLSWNGVPGASGYILQVGTSAGASNVVVVTVPQQTVSGIAPAGIYFWRVLAANGAIVSSPSAENQFNVGGCAPPDPPQSFAYSVVGSRVTLRWSGGAASYIIEAGSAPGLSNLYNASTGSAATELSVDAPEGTYFVRVRGSNACGTSARAGLRTSRR